MYGPLKAGGNGFKGVGGANRGDSRAIRAVLFQSQILLRVRRPHAPFLKILIGSDTTPLSPNSTDAGITANQLRFTL